LEWQSTGSDDAYSVSFETTGVVLKREERFDTGFDYRINLLNARGQVVDSFTDNDLGDDFFELMRNLFETAKRTALGTEQVYDQVIGELEDPF
jgi:hypothetical protein